jgi:pimeloyl-ACP methyl ester carboxylesterase
VLSLLPQGSFPWRGGLSGKVDEDRQSAIDQVVALRAGLDVLQKEAGDVPIGFVGHDYGAMFGSLLVADGRPDAYVLMAPDATFANWFVKYLLGGQGSASEYQAAFAPLDPVNYVGEAGPAPVFFQFAKSDPYVPGYIAGKFVEAAPDAEEGNCDGGHESSTTRREPTGSPGSASSLGSASGAYATPTNSFSLSAEYAPERARPFIFARCA